MKTLIYPFFSYLNLIGLVLLFFLILLFLLPKTKTKLDLLLKRFGYQIIFLVSVLAFIGSLAFSEVLGWVPCKLCWYQRTLMYPQVLISLIAVKSGDFRGYYYHFWLSFLGFFVAFFHYLIQKGVVRGIDCNLVATTGTCTLNEFAFGFVSIPFMAATAFLLIFVVSLANVLSKQR